MRIAQIPPLAESVPPKLYGGTERVVSWLTEELIALGHEVTLLASGDSVTRELRVVGFYSHVDQATREAALASGVDDVLPRSAFTARLPAILAGTT